MDTFRRWLAGAAIAAIIGGAAGCQPHPTSSERYAAEVVAGERIDRETNQVWNVCEHVRTIDSTLIALGNLSLSQAQKRLIANLRDRRAEIVERYAQAWKDAPADIKPRLYEHLTSPLAVCDDKEALFDRELHRDKTGIDYLPPKP